MKDGALLFGSDRRSRSWIKGRNLLGFAFSVILRLRGPERLYEATLFEENQAANDERWSRNEAEKNATKIAGATASKQLVRGWKEESNTKERNDRAGDFVRAASRR